MRDQSGGARHFQCTRQRDRCTLCPSAIHTGPHLRRPRPQRMSETSTKTSTPVTIVTQTRVQAGKESEFTRWQDDIGKRVAGHPGFIEQTVTPPNPPAQVDWVIQQHFTSSDAAVAWLHSEERTGLVQQIQPLLAGADDIHIVTDREAGVRPAPISAVISTRIKPGQEAAY